MKRAPRFEAASQAAERDDGAPRPAVHLNGDRQRS